MVNEKKCVLCKQKSSSNVTLFSFPANAREEWAEFCSIPLKLLPVRALLCSQHFSSDQFKSSSQVGSGRRLSLKQDAIPNLHSITGTTGANTMEIHPTTEVKIDQVRKYKVTPKRKYRYCCICGNVAVSELPKMSFISFPLADSFRSTWLESLQLTEFKPWYRICQRHFKEGNPDNTPTRALIFEALDSAQSTSEIIPPCGTRTLRKLVRATETNVNRTTPVTAHSGLISTCTDTEKKGDCALKASNGFTAGVSVETRHALNSPESRKPDSTSGHLTLNRSMGTVGTNVNRTTPTSADSVSEGTCSKLEKNTASHESTASISVETKNIVSSPPTGSRKRYYRYFMEFSQSDLATPRRKQRCLELGRSEIMQYRRKIDALSHQNQRLRKRVASLEEALNDALNKELMSESAVEAIKLV